MTLHQPQNTAIIKSLFSEEIALLGGTVVNSYEDRSRLFLRATMPRFREVGREDSVQCGVAVRAEEDTVRVHPYVFRLLCKNGAIMAHALQTHEILNSGGRSGEEFERVFCAAVRDSGSEEAFSDAAEQMRSAQDIEADRHLSMLAFLASHQTHHIPPDTLAAIMESFFSSAGRSRFNLMNAFTAAARDVADPELRWNLEEWGGGIAVGLTPRPVRDAGAAVSLEAARREWRAELPTDALERECIPA